MARVNPFRFSTKYQDDETDLLYYGYRYYSASTGRWLSRDPLNERGGANLSCFLMNDGINTIDKLGLSPLSLGQFVWPCVKDLVKKGFLTGMSKYADKLGACGSVATLARTDPDFNICGKPYVERVPFSPTYDGQTLSGALVGCLGEALKGKALKDVADETERRIIEEILNKGGDAAVAGNIETSVTMKILVQCKAGQPVLNISYATDIKAAGKSVSLTDSAGDPFQCPESGPLRVQHGCCCAPTKR